MKTADGLPIRHMWDCPMPHPTAEGVGFPILHNARHRTVYTATRTCGAYNHHSTLIRHADAFFGMWSNHPLGEGGPGQKVNFSVSPDGDSWADHRQMFPAPDSIRPSKNLGLTLLPQRWVTIDGELHALANCHHNTGYTDAEGTKIVATWDEATRFKIREPQGVLIRNVAPDGTLGPIYASEPSLPARLPFDVSCLDDAKDASFVSQMKGLLTKGLHELGSAGHSGQLRRPEAVRGHPLCEAVAYQAADGRFVKLERDSGYSHRMFFSSSADGAAWSAPRATDIPDAPSLTCALRAPNGAILLVGNQTAPAFDDPHVKRHYRRYPLTVSISPDGYTFTRAYALRCGKQDFRVDGIEGRGGGGQYPDALIHAGQLHVLYSMGKEDIAFSSVDLADLGLA